jgi:hypothetical protein
MNINIVDIFLYSILALSVVSGMYKGSSPPASRWWASARRGSAR